MNSMNFKDKTILVTGASKGIGSCIVKKFVELNAAVIATATKKTSFTSKFNENKRIECVELDFLNEESVDNFTKYLESKNIEVLVNNAGIHCPEVVGEISQQTWDNILKVNLYGPMILSNIIAKKMKKNKKGRIVNISSIAGVVSRSGSAAYSASKSGLLGFTRACALDMSKYNVLVNAVCPGTTQTEMVKNIFSTEQKKSIINSVPLKRLAEPREIAELVVFLSSEMNTYMTGQSLIIDGGLTIQ